MRYLATRDTLTVMRNLTDDLNVTIASEIRRVAGERNVSGAQIARTTGLPTMYVHRRLSGSASISVEDLIELSTGIGIEPLDMFAQILTALDLEPVTATS